jgi:hypothetical protein
MLTGLSCQTKINFSDAVIGFWTIDEINDSDEYLICFLTNGIHFEENYCQMPVSNGVCSEVDSRVRDASWFIESVQGEYILHINSDNNFFSGQYIMRFIDDRKERLLKVELQRESLTIRMRKALVHYESEKSRIRQLQRLTQSPANADL